MKKLLLFFLFGTLSLYAASQDQHALLIGINRYAPPAGYTPSAALGRLDFPNLEGCIHDAEAMRSLILSKYGFKQRDIDTLYNEAATRSAILGAMDALLQKSKKGDIAFIFYAGHGSEVRNSLSYEADKLDQTIVPADTWREGVKDVRDKELATVFNAFIDKGVKLTVIFDCCHSGSISRGPHLNPDRVRYMPMENWDARDASRPQIPEDRKDGDFLIFSAAQSDEFAAEAPDDHQIMHGAFTLALMEAMNQQSVNASALDVFSSARAILKSNGKKQEPVIGASTARQRQTLFGISKGKLPDYMTVAVSGLLNHQVLLQGGYAAGLFKQNELAMIGDQGDTLFKLRIDTVLDITRSLASVTEGDIRQIKPGYRFRVTNWVSEGRPLLRIYLPSTGVSEAALSKWISVADQLRQSGKIKWVNGIGKDGVSPYVSVFWENDTCLVKVDTGQAREIKEFSASAILQACKQDSTLYVELPVSQSNLAQIRRALSENKGLEIISQAADANYTLFGKLGKNGLPAYGFRKTEIDPRDSLESMPLVTDCFELPGHPASDKNIGDSLLGVTYKLSKIRGWLTLRSPDAGRSLFPFHLEIFDEDAKKTIQDGHYRIGENVSIRLEADPGISRSRLGTRYVYVFGVDQSGSMYLLFPGDGSNVNNKFPVYNKDTLITAFDLTGAYAVPAPSGTDNYFILATQEPIQNAGLIFNQDGVYSGVGSRGAGGADPLSALLDMGNARSRGLPSKLPATWSLKKYAFRCTY